MMLNASYLASNSTTTHFNVRTPFAKSKTVLLVPRTGSKSVTVASLVFFTSSRQTNASSTTPNVPSNTALNVKTIELFALRALKISVWRAELAWTRPATTQDVHYAMGLPRHVMNVRQDSGTTRWTRGAWIVRVKLLSVKTAILTVHRYVTPARAATFFMITSVAALHVRRASDLTWKLVSVLIRSARLRTVNPVYILSFAMNAK